LHIFSILQGVQGTSGAALQAVDLVAFGKQELGQVRPILPGATGDESFSRLLKKAYKPQINADERG